MQYSKVLIALFAAKALASPLNATPVTDVVTNDYPETDDTPVETNDYPSETTDYPSETTDYPSETTDYPTENTDYPESTYDNSDYPVNEYVPKQQSCYTKDEPVKYGKPLYFAEDSSAYEKYEKYATIKHFEYPEQIDANQPCPISYEQDSSSTYKGTYKVAICNSSDGYKTCEDVCDSAESCKSYVPKDSYIPSDDSTKGCMYRFKAYEADSPEKCTYSSDFPIYNAGYYKVNPDCKPEPSRCPPPKYVIPAKPVAPVSPAAPVYSATSPAAPVAPVYPTNDTATVPAVQPYDSGASSFRSSFTAIVGMAAVVAFAL